MIERISLKQMREEWPGWATRHKVGVIVMAVVVIGLSIGKLFVPVEKIVPVKPLMQIPPHSYYVPAKIETEVDFDRKPFPAEESCAIFELSQKLPGSVCDAATIAKGKH